MLRPNSCARTALLTLACVGLAAHAAEPLPEIVVRGEYRETPLEDLPASVSVIDQRAIRERGAQHLEDVLAITPNVVASAGASRGRYFQVRGIGERGQFADPINPSIGLVIDGIDMSGAAGVATLFDVEQVEVFRGPQGTRYGANAHAGLIRIETNDPTTRLETRAEVELGNFDAWGVGGVISGPLAGERLLGRLAVHHHHTDGYYDNAFLDREDTNERNETSVRGKLEWRATPDLTARLTAAWLEADNGYDAFTFENTRTTLSDQPGEDDQRTQLVSGELLWTGPEAFRVETLLGWSDSRIDYAFDVDWTFTGFHPDGFTAFDQYLRDRGNWSAEVRTVSSEPGRVFGGSTSWVAGLYAIERQVDLTRNFTFFPGPFTSTYRTGRLAGYGQLETRLSPALTLTTGLRYERREAHYDDSNGVTADPSENLWGARVTLDWLLADDLMAYATVARGYKAGGNNTNTDPAFDESLREFDSETLWNYELGLKGSFLDDRLSTRLAAFWMERKDQQVETSSTVAGPGGSTRFLVFTDNAAEGTNIGLEAEANWAPTGRLELFGSLGLLETEYEEFVNSQGDDLSGREQAHAPEYQFTVGGEYRFDRGLYARVTAEGRDDMFWDTFHDERARTYAVVNARLGWSRGPWEVAVWGRNLTDENYGVRGFGGFVNDPRDFGGPPQEYIQFGEPRVLGLTASWDP